MIVRESWSERVLQRLGELADRPVALVLILLAANAVARPYAGIEHDAQLYSVQVLNQMERGAFDHDLFFRYGSQNRYSLFSVVMAPFAGALGVKLAFFLGYLASDALFVVGLVRLLSRLVDDGLLRIVSLVYLAVAPLNYGGLSTFHVHESFLTARLPAVGLVLLALAYLLEQRPAYVRSLLLMVLAGTIHPLIATGGFLTWSGVLLVDKLEWRGAMALVLGVAGAACAAVPAVAGQLLGDMDDEWRQAILVPSPYAFASEWQLCDWSNVVFGFVCVSAGVFIFRKDAATPSGDGNGLACSRTRLVAVVGLVGLAAVAGTILAEHLPYALLLQGQPYRALWIVKVLQVPLGFLLADRLLRAPRLSLKLAASVPLVFLLASDLISFCFAIFFVPSSAMFVRGLASTPRRSDWLVCVLPWAILQGEIAASIYREVDFLRDWNSRLDHNDVFVLLRLVLENVGIVPWMIAVFAAAYCLLGRQVSRKALGLTAAGFLAVQTSFFVLPDTAYAREHSPHMSDVMFVRDFLRQQPAHGKKPTIYSEYGRVEYVWLEMDAVSYFDWWQLSGFVFGRQTAMEGQRRAALVGPFEVRRYREMRNHERIERFFRADPDAAAPTVADLARLCAEPELDYVVLKQEFPGHCSATNGRVHVYDCRKLRDQLQPSNPTAPKGPAVGQPARAEAGRSLKA